MKLEIYYKYLSIFFNVIHIFIYIGVIKYEPNWVTTYNRYLKLFIGILFVLLFNPIKKIEMNLSDKFIHMMGFSAGFILLTPFFIDLYYL